MEGDGTQDWRAGLPPEIAQHPSVANFKDVGDLAKSWVNAQALIGAEKLVLPKDEKDEQGWNQVFAKLGRPEKPDGYELPTLEGLPEGFTVDGNRVKSFMAEAHKLGLSKRQAAQLYQYYVTESAGVFTNSLTQFEDTRATAEKALRAEWGQGYEAQIALAKKTLAWAVGEDDLKVLGATYGNDPRMLRLLAKVGNAISEDVLGPGSPKPGDLTPDAAQKEINAIMGDPKHPYHVKEHPEHDEALRRVGNLFELVHGKEVMAGA